MAKFVSANAIYRVMKGADSGLTLTREQQNAVEQASVSSPSLVVAGAGSGKTELMAVRVLWLVANGYAKPQNILGLTFTRKAASELSKRIFENLLKLREAEDGAYWEAAGLEFDFTPPTVTTYNAYSNGLFRENALGLGYEAESTLLTEAAAFQLARDVVIKYGASIDARLADLDQSVDGMVEAVLQLAASMNDNLINAREVGLITNGIVQRLAALPRKTAAGDTTPFGYITETVSKLTATEILAKLADSYREEKRRLGYVDYSDQVALAERAARENPSVADAERGKFTQVLLDEYQDTSFLQTRLLATLFGGGSVFAVGDPNQSIYGWRGASASNLAKFGKDFGATVGPDGLVDRFELSTSWRNPVRVLELANHLAEELRSPAPYVLSTTEHLTPLVLQSRSDAPEGRVVVRFEQTLEDEVAKIAEWFQSILGPVSSLEPKPTAAILMRKRANMALLRDTLEAAGLEVEVVGLGGLLELPEVVDLISALRVIHDPSRGTDLVRLLTGARWRIGPKDIDHLYRYARNLNRYYSKTDGFAPEDSLSLIDALDHLTTQKGQDESEIPQPALARMVNAAETFANLRTQTGLPLVEFVRLVERELWLDVEVMANPKRKHPMAHLNAFANIVASYANSNHRPHLGAFLKWLDYANTRERFEVPTTQPESGVVQILTVHAAKGLEWDAVAIANLVDGDFPSEGKGTSGWISAGKMPYPLRGDKASLPRWEYQIADTQPELNKTINTFKADMKAHLYREELRLMYVAVTRPKKFLLLTGSYWKPGVKKAKVPSKFLLKASQLDPHRVEIINRHDESILPPIEAQENPSMDAAATQEWPLDPLGQNHGPKVRAAEELVRKALQDMAVAHAGGQIDEIELLLREREERIRTSTEVQLPVRINASGFKDYVTKPAETAARMLRPIPVEPFKATRAGTIFHAMMEQRFAGLERVLSDNPDVDLADAGEQLWAEQLGSVDLTEHQETIAELQATFATSKWANQVPYAAEIEIQLAIANNIFICKLDAVFVTQDAADNQRFEIVDWKTGKAPTDAQDIADRSLQLALYRLAFATLKQIPLESVEACLYFVSENQVVTPSALLNRQKLLERWAAVTR